MMTDQTSLLWYTRYAYNLAPLPGYLIGYELVFCTSDFANDSAFLDSPGMSAW